MSLSRPPATIAAAPSALLKGDLARSARGRDDALNAQSCGALQEVRLPSPAPLTLAIKSCSTHLNASCAFSAGEKRGGVLLVLELKEDRRDERCASALQTASAGLNPTPRPARRDPSHDGAAHSLAGTFLWVRAALMGGRGPEEQGQRRRARARRRSHHRPCMLCVCVRVVVA